MADEFKADMRSRMRRQMRSLPDAKRHSASAAACRRLVQLEAFKHASVVMLYMPLVSEVDLTSAAVRCYQLGKTVCVPKVDWERKEMAAVEVSSFDDHVMDIDEHGLRCPRHGQPIPPRAIDLVVVPGLAFDTQGNRLGRGGGYYDRFLGRLRSSATSVGLAFDFQIVDLVPADDRDVSVNLVVTDRRVIHAQPTRSRQ